MADLILLGLLLLGKLILSVFIAGVLLVFVFGAYWILWGDKRYVAKLERENDNHDRKK